MRGPSPYLIPSKLCKQLWALFTSSTHPHPQGTGWLPWGVGMALALPEPLFPHLKNGSTVSVYVCGRHCAFLVLIPPPPMVVDTWSGPGHLPACTAQPPLPFGVPAKAGNGNFPGAGCPRAWSSRNGAHQGGWASFGCLLESVPKSKITQQSGAQGTHWGSFCSPN